MNTIYGQDLWNSGADKLRNCGEGFGGRKAVAALRKDFSRFLRFAAVLLLMVVGVSGAKGQETTDYSGTYYIASNWVTPGGSDHHYDATTLANNYYLCPTEGWIYYKPNNNWSDDGTTYPNPFLTTFLCRTSDYDSYGGINNAKWKISKHGDYYAFLHMGTSKYMLFSTQKISGCGDDRMRVHLEAVTGDLPNNALFSITPSDDGTSIIISPISIPTDHLTINGGDKNALTGQEGKTGGPSGYANTAGTIGIWRNNKTDDNKYFYFEDVILPIIEQQDNNIITITCPGCTIYYTTNGTKPDLENVGGGNPTQIYSGTPITMENAVTTVKAIAVKAKGEGETLDTYSRCVTLTTQRYIGREYPYMFQNVECTNFYMIPGDVSSGNTTVNTSSLFRSTMTWNFFNAGSDGDVQYYYIRNGSNYLYRTGDNVYMKTSSDFDDSDGFKFSIVQGYKAENDPDGFHIVPKGVTDNTYCIFKGGWSSTTLANSKADVVKGNKNAREYSQKHTRWNFIAAPDNKLPASLTYDSTDPTDAIWPAFLSSSTATKFFKIENVGAEGNYMNPPTDLANGFVAATGTSGNDLAWCIVEAGHDDWQKYYYIINAATGKYMYYTPDIPDDPTTIGNKDKVIALRDYVASESIKYQFVFAKSTVEDAYYIVPKGLTDATYSSYYALYRNETNPLKSKADRYNDSYKWKFVAADLFCNDPVFEESEGKITITCRTFGAEIHYTIDGSDPTGSSTQYAATTNLILPAEGNMVVKAIATISDGATPTPNTISSAVATMLYKPDITLSKNTYTYNGGENKPTVTAVSITTTQGTTTADATAYSSPSYSADVTNVGTPTITVIDADETDTWYIWNASATYTITRKAVNITADNATKTYNGIALTKNTFAASALEDGDTHTFTVVMTEGSTITNVGTQPNVIATVDGVAVTSGTATDVGNYKVTTANGTLTINPKSVTITADDATKTYNGTALTKNTFTVSALEDGDSHTFTVVMTDGSTITNAGTQPNVIATVDGVAVTTGTETTVGNYKVNTANGTLTVTAKEVTITAKSTEKEYDGTPLTESGFTTTALEEGDTHTFAVVMTTGSTITNVGTKDNEIATVDGVAVTTGTETTVGNYKVTTVKGTLTVTKKTLTITADSGEKVYDGTPLTKNSYTNTDLLSGDVLESVTVTGTRTDAGESDNVPSAAVIKNANSEVITESYNVVYKNGKLKVTAKPVTITADSGEKEYDGTALTKNTYTHTALVEGHTITSVTITGSQTNVGTGSNVPSAAVIKKGETVVTANYNITYTNGTLKITPAAATVTADAKTKVYGDAEPTYTATVTGLKNNEAASVLTYTFSRATGENVGEYTITPAGEATQGNYTVTYATGKLTITKAAANVKADDKTKGYGDADPAFTATVTGLKNGDAASVLTYTFSRAEGENVNAGGYTITPAGNAEQGNYTVTYATGKLTITPKAINDGTNPAEGIDVDITYDGGTNYTVVVKQGEKTLVKDTDYELPEGSENQYDDADGNHVITIKGKDGSNYTGSFKATYIKLTFWDTTPDQTLTSETTAAVYCATQNLKVNESFEAYYVTNLADNTLTLTKVEAGDNKKNYIPANQPLLLISDAATAPKGFTVKPYTDTDVVTIPASGEGSNLLKVVTDEGGLAVALTQVYIFSQGEFVLTKAGTMSKGKFYLENPNYSTPAPSRSIIRITTEGTTDINTAQYIDTDSQHSDTWYTIGGQKLNKKPTRKGLYLQNGKKVVIK